MWFKVCNSLAQHRKAMEAGPAAMGLWTLAGAWSCGQLTDGFIPDWALPRLAPDAEALASRLVHANLWHRAEGGYQFHEWSEIQPSAAEELELREQRREAGRTGGVRSGKARRKQGSRATRKPSAEAHGEASASAHAQANTQAKTNPDPDPEGVPYGTHSEVSKRSASNGTTPDRFDEFWSVYPCKKAKKAAQKYWQRALKDTDADTIIAGARRYAESRAGQDPQYTCMPTTWLNQGRWDDEAQRGPPSTNGYRPWTNPTDPSAYEGQL